MQDELRDVPLHISCRKIGDFGCGAGYTTRCLMLARQAGECIGIDKFSDDLLSPSCQDV